MLQRRYNCLCLAPQLPWGASLACSGRVAHHSSLPLLLTPSPAQEGQPTWLMQVLLKTVLRPQGVDDTVRTNRSLGLRQSVQGEGRSLLPPGSLTRECAYLARGQQSSFPTTGSARAGLQRDAEQSGRHS